jgi:UDP-N-acetyl-D-mannosaminuronate dehydrogenase
MKQYQQFQDLRIGSLLKQDANTGSLPGLLEIYRNKLVWVSEVNKTELCLLCGEHVQRNGDCTQYYVNIEVVAKFFNIIHSRKIDIWRRITPGERWDHVLSSPLIGGYAITSDPDFNIWHKAYDKRGRCQWIDTSTLRNAYIPRTQ